MTTTTPSTRQPLCSVSRSITAFLILTACWATLRMTQSPPGSAQPGAWMEGKEVPPDGADGVAQQQQQQWTLPEQTEPAVPETEPPGLMTLESARALGVKDLGELIQPGERVFSVELQYELDIFDQSTPIQANMEETFIMCKAIDISDWPGVHVVGWDPLLDVFDEDGGPLKNEVHHIDVFMCDKSALRTFVGYKRCDNFVRFFDAQNGPCYYLGIVHDRKALSYSLPTEAGIPVGGDIPSASVLCLSVHYLFPFPMAKYQMVAAGGARKYVDRSGFRVYVTPDKRPHDAGTFTLIDSYLNIPGETPAHEVNVDCTADDTAALIGNSIDKFGAVFPLSLHLHGHFLLDKTYSSIIKPDGREVMIGAFDEFSGEGQCQSFFDVDDHKDKRIEQGDAIRMACTFNTEGVDHPTRYGIGHGQEMCGSVMLFYPYAGLGPRGSGCWLARGRLKMK